MRRQDREVKDFDKITATIEGCDCCRLGLNDDGQVYIVPMNFGFKVQNNNIVLYFHGASEGRKIDILKRNPHVGFEMDTGHHLNEADIACKYSFAYMSIIGNGKVMFIEERKEEALNIIFKHYGVGNKPITAELLSNTCVFKLEVENFSCKEHK